MPVAPTLGQFTYVCKCDKDLPVSEQTVFKLRTLHWKERESLFGEQNGLAIARRVLNWALLGWSNFKDADGNDFEFRRVDEGKHQVLPAEILDRLVIWSDEIATEVMNRTTITEEQARNFTSP